MKLALWGLGAAAAPYASHRLALWLEGRGWLYYVHNRRRGRVWLAFAAAFDPNARRRPAERLEHETGLEPATSTLATWSSTN